MKLKLLPTLLACGQNVLVWNKDDILQVLEEAVENLEPKVKQQRAWNEAEVKKSCFQWSNFACLWSECFGMKQNLFEWNSMFLNWPECFWITTYCSKSSPSISNPGVPIDVKHRKNEGKPTIFGWVNQRTFDWARFKSELCMFTRELWLMIPFIG